MDRQAGTLDAECGEGWRNSARLAHRRARAIGALAWLGAMACVACGASPAATASASSPDPTPRASSPPPRRSVMLEPMPARSRAAPLGVRDELRGLLDLAAVGWPVTAEMALAYLEPRAVVITRSNRNLDHPTWADRAGHVDDTFVELGGEIAGARLPVERPGWGQYVELYVPDGALSDVEAVVGSARRRNRSEPRA